MTTMSTTAIATSSSNTTGTAASATWTSITAARWTTTTLTTATGTAAAASSTTVTTDLSPSSTTEPPPQQQFIAAAATTEEVPTSSSSSVPTIVEAVAPKDEGRQEGDVSTIVESAAAVAVELDDTQQPPVATTGMINSNATTTTSSSNHQRRRNILFMHVAKTGGTTIKNRVLKSHCKGILSNQRKRNECYNMFNDMEYESVLSKNLKHTLHVSDYNIMPSFYRSYSKMINEPHSITDIVFSIREPIARFISWYNYFNPRNCETYGYKISCERRNSINKYLKSTKATNTTLSAEPMTNSIKTLQKRINNDSRYFNHLYWVRCFPTIDSFLTRLTNITMIPTANDQSDNHNHLHNGSQSHDICNLLIQGTFVPTPPPSSLSIKKGKKIIINDNKDENSQSNISQPILHVPHAYINHLKCNYQWHTTVAHMNEPYLNMSSYPTTWVIRTENLKEDTEYIDKEMGGTGNLTSHLKAGTAETHIKHIKKAAKATEVTAAVATTTTTDDDDEQALAASPVPVATPSGHRLASVDVIDPQHLLSLCCALLPDIKAYVNIIEHSHNLNDDIESKFDTYRLTWERCNLAVVKDHDDDDQTTSASNNAMNTNNWSMLDDKCQNERKSLYV